MGLDMLEGMERLERPLEMKALHSLIDTRTDLSHV
jgi:hypothetical protein